MSEENQNPQLALSDLVAATNTINQACLRGAFNGSESATVGNIFNKLANAIREMAPAADEVETSADESEDSVSQENEVDDA